MASVMKSQLNPLADTFIPNYRPITSQKSIRNSKNETKTTRERIWNQSSNDWDSKHEDLTVVTVKHFPKGLPIKDWAEYLLLGGITTTILNFILQNPFISKTPLSKFTKWQLPILPKSPIPDLVQLENLELVETASETTVEETDECNCPPMFGWSVPPNFIGNPFNFKYECSKKYPHGPEPKEKLRCDKDTLDLDTKINGLTLDECYSAMKDILTDVYETISMDSDTVVKCDKGSKMDYLEVSDNGSDNEENNKSKTLSLASPSEITTEPELIDDGIHPLLQSAPVREQDEDLLNVEKILERSLCRSLSEPLEAETSCTVAVCDPPCSVWCEYLPSAAKDTFQKYIQKKSTKDSKQQRSLGQKPAFKRSLSADDAPMNTRLNKDLNQTLALESRDMLLLRRKDPLSYFRVRSVLMDKRKSISYDSIDQQLVGDSNIESSMWGKFDSADSLWRPLPECLPVNGYPKANIRKGHETRMQRTLT